jgi:hypothetical protein
MVAFTIVDEKVGLLVEWAPRTLGNFAASAFRKAIQANKPFSGLLIDVRN